VSFLLTERAHSKSAYSMRAVKGSLGRSPKKRFGKFVCPRPVGLSLGIVSTSSRILFSHLRQTVSDPLDRHCV